MKTRTLLLEMLDQAYAGPHWNGVSLRGSLRGVSAKRAARRPGRGRPSIWEYMLHCAWWKDEVRRRITGDAVGVFPRGPANFPALPERITEAAWKADRALLAAAHRALRDAVERMPEARLLKRVQGKSYRHIDQVHGVAAHDAYHTGQIQVVKQLLRR